MSRDYFLLLDTESSPDDLRETLTTNCGVVTGDNGWFVSDEANVRVTPTTPSNLHLPEPGIPRATCMAKFLPHAKAEDAIYKVFRMAVTLMQKHQGNAALTAQDANSASTLAPFSGQQTAAARL